MVAALRSGSCRDAEVMQLLRLLHFAAAELQFTFTSVHIPGSSNVVADAQSSNHLSVAVSVSSASSRLLPHSLNLDKIDTEFRPRLYLRRLENSVSSFFAAGIAARKSTARTYRCGQDHSGILQTCSGSDGYAVGGDFVQLC